MLVHICCSVDSHYFLKKLQEEYPQERFIGFFYDPNIHPYSEYRLRLQDVQFSCKKLGIELLEGEYDLENWLRITKGLENEPEKGERCTVCFDNRLEVSAKKALQLNHDKFTTTLLISPKKSQEKLLTIGESLEKKYGIKFVFKDYRSGNGMELQNQEVKQNNLYRQNYCGCLYALNSQRVEQKKLADEMMNPINQQIQPESIEERLQLYKQRENFQNQKYEILKERFLNYRLLWGKVVVNKEVLPSYILSYSTLKNRKTVGKIEKIVHNIGYLNRDEVRFLSLETFNFLTQNHYKNLYELIYHPLSFEEELNFRNQLCGSSYDLGTIIIIEEIPTQKVEIFLKSEVFEDVREKIVLLENILY